MKIYFSKRHIEAIRNNELPLEFAVNLRTSILRTLKKFSDWGGWNLEENFSFENTKEILKTFYGKHDLEVVDENNKHKKISISGIVMKGQPVQVIDVIEAWFDQCHRQEVNRCESELNSILKINNSPWRFENGEALLINSDYLYEEILSKTLRLLRTGDEYPVLDKFHNAVMGLQSGNYKTAVAEAHNSVSEVTKHTLELQKDYPLHDLLTRLTDSGMIPAYYKDFLECFEKLVDGAVKNLPDEDAETAGLDNVISRNLAEFAINLSGAINLFIIQSALKTTISR
jgi:hypothetical protein